MLLDVEPGHAVGAKADKDRLEDAGDVFHQRVREYFLGLAARDPEHYLVVDARGTREDIAEAIAERVRELLVAAELSEPAGTVGG